MLGLMNRAEAIAARPTERENRPSRAVAVDRQPQVALVLVLVLLVLIIGTTSGPF